MVKQKIKIGNRKESTLQKGVPDVIQKSPYYKVFEYDQLETKKYVPKVQSPTTYTTLGVRKGEVEEDAAGYITSTKTNPQGMSLLSNIQAAQTSVLNPNNCGLFEIEENLYKNRLSILQDPQNKVHYLWGPEIKLLYHELDGQIKNSRNSWDIKFEYIGGWQKIEDNSYKGKRNKNRKKNIK